MNNNFFLKIKNVLKIEVEGKNVERFIRKLINKKIVVLDIKYLKYNKILLKVYEEDLKQIEEMKTIYDISIVGRYGMKRIKNICYRYKLLIINMIIGFIILLFLMNIVTKVEIIHSDSSLRNLLLNELKEYGVNSFHLKKSYQELEIIKKKILDIHKDKIEWLEIESIGTTYKIRVEERKINEKKESGPSRNIVAKKSAIIKKVEAINGVVIKEENSYATKGETIISGEIYLNEELKNVVEAQGKVYGEVWYKSSIEFPYLYNDTAYTGNKKEVYSIKFLNWNIDIFNFHPFKNSKKKEKILIKHPFLPFRLVKEEQSEMIVNDKIYTIEEAKEEAKKLGIKKMKDNLDVNEYIIGVKDLKMTTKKSKIRLDLFFTIYEDITDYTVIDLEQLQKKEKAIE